MRAKLRSAASVNLMACSSPEATALSTRSSVDGGALPLGASHQAVQVVANVQGRRGRPDVAQGGVPILLGHHGSTSSQANGDVTACSRPITPPSSALRR